MKYTALFPSMTLHATSITLRRAEGPVAQCGHIAIVHGRTCWAQADRWLTGQAASAPLSGATNKVDFTVTYSDGYEYDGTYLLKHSTVEAASLADHMRRFNDLVIEQCQVPAIVALAREFNEKYAVGV